VDQVDLLHWCVGLREGSHWEVVLTLGAEGGLCLETLFHCDHLHHCLFVEQVHSLDLEVPWVWDHLHVVALEDPLAPSVQVVP